MVSFPYHSHIFRDSGGGLTLNHSGGNPLTSPTFGGHMQGALALLIDGVHLHRSIQKQLYARNEARTGGSQQSGDAMMVGLVLVTSSLPNGDDFI